MSIYTEITNLESILTNCANDHSCEELASMEEELSKLEHIKDLWLEFGDIPMNPCLEIIEQPWHGFPAGTHRETIWHWFEDEFKVSVAKDLMYPDAEPEKANPHFKAFIHGEIERKSITVDENMDLKTILDEALRQWNDFIDARKDCSLSDYNDFILEIAEQMNDNANN